MALPPASERSDELDGSIALPRAQGQRLDTEAAKVLESLYVELAPSSYAYLRARGMDPESAKDVLHSAFEKIGRHIRRGHAIDKPKEFVSTVVRSAWVDWHRDPERRSCPVQDAGSGEADQHSEQGFERVVELHDHQKLLLSLEVALQELPRRQAEVVVMHKLSDTPIAGIAKGLGISEITVRYHLSMGLRRLRQLLKSSGSWEEGESP